MTNYCADDVFCIVIFPAVSYHHKLVACVVMFLGDFVNMGNVPVNSVHLYF